MLFLMYTAPLADVIRLYADDTQIYLSFELSLAAGKNEDRSLRKWYRQVDVAELA